MEGGNTTRKRICQATGLTSLMGCNDKIIIMIILNVSKIIIIILDTFNCFYIPILDICIKIMNEKKGNNFFILKTKLKNTY